MSLTEAQKRATKKYHDKLATLQLRLPIEEKEEIANHVLKTNESIAVFVRRAVKEAMERDIIDSTPNK